MKKAIVLVNDGFEELEMIGPYDLLKRAGVDVELVCPKDSLRSLDARD